jgi:hypothetical protein
LSAVNNTTGGPTVLPVITKGDNLTILTANGTANPGYGDTIDASGNGRLFAVAAGASLTLQNLTLQGGNLFGFGGPAEGGAIYNQGTLVLSKVMVQNNTAVGDGSIISPSTGQAAAGGGIWSNGSLTVENSTVFQGNSANGGDGAFQGGNAYGGAICIAGGTADVTGTFFGCFNFATNHMGNTAQAGNAHNWAGSAYGGAVYVGAGTVTMNADTVGNPRGLVTNFQSNSAQSATNSYGGGICVGGGTVTLTNDTIIYNTAVGVNISEGGGIYIASGATVDLDSFTLAHTAKNGARFGNNIYGTYLLVP